jgi:LacI family transcriptional regulator
MTTDAQAGRPGMREVAERAGVAISSVSRVLSNHPDVSQVMRNRVLDAVAALGYEPNFLAQSLRTGSTMTVGFIAGDISNPLLAHIALGSEIRLREGGYSMLLTNSLNDAALDLAHLQLLQQRRVDGLLLSVTDESDHRIVAAIGQAEPPLVLIDREIAATRPMAAVLSDHDHGTAAAVTHLIGLGHRRIALVGGSPRVRPTRERAKALRRVCRATPGVTGLVRNGAFTAEHGERATRELLTGPAPPTALIAGGNQILVGVLHCLRQLKVSVPVDLSLVTCDEVALSEFLEPELSAITRDLSALGRIGAELLLAQLAGEQPRREVLPTEFRATGSCAPMSVR